MRISLLSVILVVMAGARCTASAGLVFDANWAITGTSNSNGTSGELRDGTTKIADFTLSRTGTTGFTGSVVYVGGTDLLITEDGKNNSSTHTVTYTLSFASLDPNYTFHGYTTSQFGSAGTGPSIANPDIAFSWTGGGSATVGEPTYNMFSNVADGDTFASPNTLTSAGGGDISAANANYWSVSTPAAGSGLTVTYTTGLTSGRVNDESLAFAASFESTIPEPGSALFLLVIGVIAVIQYRPRRTAWMSQGRFLWK